MSAACINFIGLPHSGKTYWAIQLTAWLKQHQIDADFLEEPFKQQAYSKYPLPGLAEEIVGFGQILGQIKSRLDCGINVVTDSGLPTVCYYLQRFTDPAPFLKICEKQLPMSFNILLRPYPIDKQKLYQLGRWDTHLTQSFEDFKGFLRCYGVPYITLASPITLHSILTRLAEVGWEALQPFSHRQLPHG